MKSLHNSNKIKYKITIRIAVYDYHNDYWDVDLIYRDCFNNIDYHIIEFHYFISRSIVFTTPVAGVHIIASCPAHDKIWQCCSNLLAENTT